MIEYRIKEGNTFLGVWLGGNKGNIILACGIPQYIDKYNPIVSQVTNLGYNLFTLRYQGSFESSGEFGVNSSKESIMDAVNIVKNGKAIELFSMKEITWGVSFLY